MNNDNNNDNDIDDDLLEEDLLERVQELESQVEELTTDLMHVETEIDRMLLYNSLPNLLKVMVQDPSLIMNDKLESSDYKYVVFLLSHQKEFIYAGNEICHTTMNNLLSAQFPNLPKELKSKTIRTTHLLLDLKADLADMV